MIVSVVFVLISCSSARLFDQQLKHRGDEDGIDLRHHDQYRHHRNDLLGYEESGDAERQETDSHWPEFHVNMLDLGGLTTELAHLASSLWLLAVQFYCWLEAAFLAIFASSPPKQPDVRKSAVWISWLVLAVVGIVLAIVIKEYLIFPGGRRRQRQATAPKSKFFSFLKELTATTRKPPSGRHHAGRATCAPGGFRVHRLPPQVQAYPCSDSLRDRVASRWINYFMSKLMLDTCDRGIATCLQCWLDGLNRHLRTKSGMVCFPKHWTVSVNVQLVNRSFFQLVPSGKSKAHSFRSFYHSQRLRASCLRMRKVRLLICTFIERQFSFWH